MQGKFLLFTFRGVPVVIHPTFLIPALAWLTSYRHAAPEHMLALGFLAAFGLFASILLHEIGHMQAGRWFGIGTRMIELNGLGGLAYLNRPGRTKFQSIAISLAGPAVNLGLWLIGHGLLLGMESWNDALNEADQISSFWPEMPDPLFEAVYNFMWMNGFMLIFNLLPAFPLDGGNALREVVSFFVSQRLATKAISILGMITAIAVFAWIGRYGGGMMFLCAYLAFENWQVYQSA